MGAEDGERAERPRRDRPERGDRPERPPRGDRAERPERSERPERGERTERGERAERRPRRPARAEGDAARLYIGLGRQAGVRPGDIVGAIANETGLDARAIGAIDITDRFTIVEVPGESADDVIDALKRTTLRGKRPIVRRDRDA